MTDPSDSTEAGEIYKKSIKDALSHLDKVMEDARTAHEQAIDLQIAAKDEIHRIEREANLISKDYIERHYKEFEDRIRNKTLFFIAKKMIMDGSKSSYIMSLLEIPETMIQDAKSELGFTKLGNHLAHVTYENQGRAGNVIFYRDDVKLSFWYEFAGGNTLAFIDVPREENWLAVTGLPLEDRLPILNFIGKRVIRDQATGYRYEIRDDAIYIVP
jgi:hypothetical protein